MCINIHFSRYYLDGNPNLSMFRNYKHYRFNQTRKNYILVEIETNVSKLFQYETRQTHVLYSTSFGLGLWKPTINIKDARQKIKRPPDTGTLIFEEAFMIYYIIHFCNRPLILATFDLSLRYVKLRPKFKHTQVVLC